MMASSAPTTSAAAQGEDLAGAAGLADFRTGRAEAERIVEGMSIDEKLSLVSTYFPYTSSRREELGMVLSSAYNPGLPRLGIPELRVTDASLGVANILNGRPDETSTAFPAALAMAATFDRGLVAECGAAIGSEARARSFNILLGGGINLVRDPWAGRNFEYFSEDVLLSGVLGGAAVRGVQSNNIACTVKHYVLNAQETGRMVLDARLGMAALRESDLLAFEIAIELGRPASVMASYNKVNGHYASENAPLLAGVLKGEWGYPGWVMSDWGGVHSTEKAALAGLDQESGMELDAHLNGAIFFTDRLRDAVEAGRVPASRLDDMVTRILTGMIGCGAMTGCGRPEPAAADDEANAKVAQRTAEAGAVLLRNEALLPLSTTLKRIAVIGGHADVGVLSGGGSSQVRSHGGVPIEVALETGDAAWFCRMTYHASSPLEAIREIVPQAAVSFWPGDDIEAAAAAAAEADVAIVFATQWRTEAMDLETLALPEAQNRMIEAVAAANTRTVIVLETGGAVLMPWLEAVPAVLAAWYPGQRGGAAIARILFGEISPSGRLPISFPAADGDAPRPVPCGLGQLRARDRAKAKGDEGARIAAFPVEYREGPNVGYRWCEIAGCEPLFPFGHGLSYTRFRYEDLEVADGVHPRITLTVSNVGERAGADVPQVYVQAADSGGTRTWRLAGFQRVELEAGASERVEIELEPRAYASWDETAQRWRLEDRLPFAVGRSSRDFVLSGELKRRPGSLKLRGNDDVPPEAPEGARAGRFGRE